jgi:hypothetical protein
VSAERGQGTVEWIGLILIVSAALAVLGALAGLSLPGAALARTVVAKILCAVEGSMSCGGTPSELVLAYGGDLAELVSEKAPDFLYEEAMRELPVDYRECRADPCALAERARGTVSQTVAGMPATAFVHVVDCRPGALRESEAAGLDCSDSRAGHLFLQYWAYYPDSETVPFGARGYHADDWESFQVRLGEPFDLARASSHHSYNYEGGPGNWLSDAGIERQSGWGAYASTYHVSAGSHAGHVEGDPSEPLRTRGSRLHLVPLEPIAASGEDAGFAITPPWRKRVWSDPEYDGTD